MIEAWGGMGFLCSAAGNGVSVVFLWNSKRVPTHWRAQPVHGTILHTI